LFGVKIWSKKIVHEIENHVEVRSFAGMFIMQATIQFLFYVLYMYTVKKIDNSPALSPDSLYYCD
jgi:hypothetical protein